MFETLIDFRKPIFFLTKTPPSMKKILLFVSAIFFAGYSFAQSASDWDNPSFPVTDNTGTVVFPAGSLSDFVGGSLMAFAGGVPVSEPSEVVADGSGGVAPIGTDALCNCDLADAGEELSFAILIDGTVVVIADVNPPLTYSANMFATVGDGYSLTFTVDGVPASFGCTDANYKEFDSSANVPDGSCATLIVVGCMDAAACNYDVTANEAGSCDYVDGICDTCENGVVVDNDSDDDGLCDADDTISGCTDAAACNYDNSSTVNTDNSLCTYAADLDACATCSGEQDGTGVVVDNDADDDSVCDADEIVGCQDASAFNYDATATDAGFCVPVIGRDVPIQMQRTSTITMETVSLTNCQVIH